MFIPNETKLLDLIDLYFFTIYLFCLQFLRMPILLSTTEW